jgi:molybdopterin/thiamine biosynthesis adenylyltransferase
MELVEVYDLSNAFALDQCYRLLRNPERPVSFYSERTDRNIGWISKEEQKALKNSSVAIAGCGGMGGHVAMNLVRLGVGKIIIADPEDFDYSNLNRQLGAKITTIDSNKALATATEMRQVSDDVEILIFPQGVNEETISLFLKEADLVCDLVEFYALEPRLLLHQFASKNDIEIFTCDTVGHATNLFFFNSESWTLEKCLGLSWEKVKTMSKHEIENLLDLLVHFFAPNLPEYFPEPFDRSSIVSVMKRLKESGTASIIATNPPISAGFISTHVCMRILEKAGFKRKMQRPIPMPGYLSFDVLKLETKIQRGKYW